MAKKADLIKQATDLGLEVSEKMTVAALEAAIAEAPTANEATTAETMDEATPKVAKAGKRSAKGLEEAEAKTEKLEKQAHRDEEKAAEDDKPKQPVKPARSRLERRGKAYRKAQEQIDADKQYSLSEALELATKTNPAKFDASVELHVRLNVDPRQADQNLRDTVVLPAGTGKDVRVAVFADTDVAKEAKAAGADIAAADEFLQQLDKGTIDFDVLISTPQQMAKLGKYARLLGPKGLMPNPKSGTVTTDVTKAVKEAKAGRVEYRIDSTGIIHVGIGKVSFGGAKLLQNAQAIVDSLKTNKPTGLKGGYVKSTYVTTSMGPSIQVTASDL
jgi:large subunit ribosomal protein L1